MMYRVEFQFADGGRYYSETFEERRDADNLVADILLSKSGMRCLGVESSEDGESWRKTA